MKPKLRTELLLWLVYFGCLGCLFLPGLTSSQIPAFRDAYHFYYPQAVWLDSCAMRGEYFPVWNPNECLGVSVAGQPSASLYYPLRVLWLLPYLSLPQRYAVYLLAHVVLAGCGMRFAANTLKLPSSAGWLAAISYSLSCPVLFQHTNVIFLASAAWIGFALGAMLLASRANFRHRVSSCFIFSIACSLMCLAGDPHTAVNAIIVAAASLGLQSAMWIRATGKKRGGSLQQSWQLGLRNGAWLLSACLLVMAITAIQWVPTLRWVAHSSRFASGSMIDSSQQPELAAMLADTAEPPHAVYSFSLSPWHLGTMIWPTLGGHYLPQNSRVFDAIPGEGRMWIPSLYFGTIPCLLILPQLCHAIVPWRRKPRTAKATLFGLNCLFTLSLLLALGNYSILWSARDGLRCLGFEELARELPNDHVGSFYWILTQVIPGYAAFRYPAKWTVWMAAAASLLAALFLARRSMTVNHGDRPPRLRGLLFLSTLGLILSILYCIVERVGFASETIGGIDRWLVEHARDRLLGAPQSLAIAWSCAVAFSAPVIAILFYRVVRNPVPIVILTMFEMTIVGAQWVVFTPPPPTHAVALPTETSQFVWASMSHDVSVLGKLGILKFERTLNATQSIQPVEVDRLRQWLAQNDTQAIDQPALDAVLRQLGVSQRTVIFGGAIRLQPIVAPAAFCELFHASLGDADESAIQWTWQNASELRIRTQSAKPCRLIVRQYNDGGWEGRWSNQEGNLYPIAGRLFLEIELPAGENELQLDRKWLW